ncbi:unnamed protein product [Caenorhabditis angaria]|uniref:Glycosyltransferase family 92 protein n=1 Tax=Caenorhabditis angaria TaxID=860376 RepID=A0A9P1IYE5_9PELO|nr:unnamed protein product [Caenorhabditis angaria]
MLKLVIIENQANDSDKNGKIIHPIAIHYLEHRDIQDFKAFITSSYYYPESKSLGSNALALVMSINLKRGYHFGKKEWYESAKQPIITIRARNLISSKVISSSFKKITPDDNACYMVSIFLTVQLLPNTISVELLGDNGDNSVSIPFSIPPSTNYHDVVVCISPIFVAENWQTFLFAMHIYKKFGAFVNLYYISAVDSFYELIKIYEEAGYLTIQPWVSIKLVGVDQNELDPYHQIEFRNQAAAQTDCILKYKETAKFVTCLDLDDILIPKFAPTYLEEFQTLLKKISENSYLTYDKRNYRAHTVNKFNKFSLSKMLESIEIGDVFESGKIVTDPKLMNFTWIHWTLNKNIKRVEVKNNWITHLKNVTWFFGIRYIK